MLLQTNSEELSVSQWIEEKTQALSRRFQFGPKKQADLLEAFAQPLKIGASRLAIAAHIEKHGDKVQQRIARDIRLSLQSGGTICDGLSGWIEPLSLSALRAAEEGGNDSFIEGLEYLAQSLGAAGQSKAVLLKKCGYPTGMLLLTTGLMLYINAKVVPMFEGIMEGEVDPSIQTFKSVAGFYTTWLIPLLILISGIVLYARYWLSTSVGDIRDSVDRFALFAGYRLSVGAKMVTMYGLLKKFGLSALDILNLMQRTGTPYQKYHIYLMKEQLRSGVDHEIDALDTGLLDEQHVSLLKLYTQGGDRAVVDALEKASVALDQQIQRRSERLAKLLSSVIFLWAFANIVLVVLILFGVNPNN